MPTDTFTTRLFPPLDATIEAALRASIERFGVIVPVVEDQHANTLDGHHRKRIAEGLGKPYEIQTVHVRDEDEAREIAHTLNADRRHLTVEQRRELVAALRREGHSYRAIAGAVGASKTTVQRDLDRLSQVGQLKPLKIVTGLDGRSRKVERKKAAVAQAQARLKRTLARIDVEQAPGVEAEPAPLLNQAASLLSRAANELDRYQQAHEKRRAVLDDTNPEHVTHPLADEIRAWFATSGYFDAASSSQ